MKAIFQSNNILLKNKGNPLREQVSNQANINKVIDDIIDDLKHGNSGPGRGSIVLDRPRTVKKMEKLRALVCKTK